MSLSFLEVMIVMSGSEPCAVVIPHATIEHTPLPLPLINKLPPVSYSHCFVALDPMQIETGILSAL